MRTDLEKKYGVAETFTSWQGEGLFAGTRQHFIRFSGCSVGKKLTAEDKRKFGYEPICRKCGYYESDHTAQDVLRVTCGEFWAVDSKKTLPIYTEKCCTVTGTEFLCDTNFQTSKAMSVREILDEIPEGVERICLTGGEPLDRDLAPLMHALSDDERFYLVHIETSGTKRLQDSFPDYCAGDNNEKVGSWLWVTVSPKKNALSEMIEIANEIKLLVDETFDIMKVPVSILKHPLVWLQPVNYEYDIRKENVERCLKLLEEHPQWRLSLQTHKIARVR